MSIYGTLQEKIARREVVCGVVGMGYVGLPLAMEMAKSGLRVIGFEKSQHVVDVVRAGRVTSATWRAGDVAELRRRKLLDIDARHGAARRVRRRLHLRADAARQDEGSRHVVHRVGHGGGRGGAASRSAHRSRIDDVSGDDARDLLPTARGARAARRRRFLPVLLAGARRSGQRAVAHEEHAEGARRHHAKSARSSGSRSTRSSSTAWCGCRRPKRPS